MRTVAANLLIFAAASAKSFKSVEGVSIKVSGDESTVTDKYPGSITAGSCQAMCDSDPKCSSAYFYFNATATPVASCSTYSGAPTAILPAGGSNACSTFCYPTAIVVTDPSRQFLAQNYTRYISNSPIARFNKTFMAQTVAQSWGPEVCSSLCHMFPKCVVSTSIDGTCTIMASDARPDPNSPIECFSYVDAEWQNSLMATTSRTSALTHTGTVTSSMVTSQIAPVTTNSGSQTPTETGANTNTSTPPMINEGHMTEMMLTGYSLSISILIVTLFFL